MSNNFREFFPPGRVYDIVGASRVFQAISAGVVLLSLVSLAILGFNRGIDFKGGTKIIVSFKEDSAVSRDALRTMLDGFIKKATGSDGDSGQIEVQEFSTGTAKASEGKDFLLLTELTSLVTQAQKDKVLASLGTAFAGARLEAATQGEDVFYIALPATANVDETYKKLEKLFLDNGFPKIKTYSEVQRQLEINNFRTLQMVSEEEGELTPEALAEREQAQSAQLIEELKKRTDDQFTVKIEEFKAKLTEDMKTQFGVEFLAVREATIVSPAVASDLLNQGLVAILYALLGIVVYIALRFDMRFAPGAIIALSHDVIIVIGCFSLAQVKFTMPIIAAILTIAGYSINDTIVVFDRIRELIEKYPKAKMVDVVNNAVSQTLSRTILTSLTTQMAVVAIFLLGGGLIRDFAFAMTVGLIVGTYSSIFIASPIFLWTDRQFERRRSAARATGDAQAVARTDL